MKTEEKYTKDGITFFENDWLISTEDTYDMAKNIPFNEFPKYKRLSFNKENWCQFMVLDVDDGNIEDVSKGLTAIFSNLNIAHTCVKGSDKPEKNNGGSIFIHMRPFEKTENAKLLFKFTIKYISYILPGCDILNVGYQGKNPFFEFTTTHQVVGEPIALTDIFWSANLLCKENNGYDLQTWYDVDFQVLKAHEYVNKAQKKFDKNNPEYFGKELLTKIVSYRDNVKIIKDHELLDEFDKIISDYVIAVTNNVNMKPEDVRNLKPDFQDTKRIFDKKHRWNYKTIKLFSERTKNE